MKIKMLLPHKYKLIGWCIAVPAFVIMMLYMYADFAFGFLEYHAQGAKISLDGTLLFNTDSNNFTDEIAGVLLIVGLLMIAFARERFEDEMTVKIRLESLLWAVLLNSALIILAIIFIYGTLFLVMMVYNICTPLIFFIARFNYVMYMQRRKLKQEAI